MRRPLLFAVGLLAGAFVLLQLVPVRPRPRRAADHEARASVRPRRPHRRGRLEPRWDRPQPNLEEVVHAIDEGDMPPAQYKLVHGDARLSAAQRHALVAGFRALYANDPPPAGGGD